MILFVLTALFSAIYNVSYALHLFKRKQILAGTGTVLSVLMLSLALLLAYNAI